MIAPVLLLVLGLSTEIVAQIRVQGNTITSDDQVRLLAGLEVGMEVQPTTVEDATARLRATKRFERVEVLKRFASIADPTQLTLVIIVDEGPVHIEMTGDPADHARVVRNRGPHLLVLPLLYGEDGYGLTYGASLAWPNPAGPRSRVSFPLTWGGNKRAAVEFDKSLEHGPIGRALAGVSISRSENPFYDADDDRRRAWLRAERNVIRFVRAGATAAWEHASLLGDTERFSSVGADVTVDTRIDPMLARNAIFARAAWERLGFANHAAHRTELEGRGYVGLAGQNILVIRAAREHSGSALPVFLKPLLGGMSTVRGFRAGSAAGDTRVNGSIELLAPLTSPLHVGKLGLIGFVDAGSVYDAGHRLSGEPVLTGTGAGVWFSAAFVRFSAVVAHGVGASTRVHVGGSVSF